MVLSNSVDRSPLRRMARRFVGFTLLLAGIFLLGADEKSPPAAAKDPVAAADNEGDAKAAEARQAGRLLRIQLAANRHGRHADYPGNQARTRKNARWRSPASARARILLATKPNRTGKRLRAGARTGPLPCRAAKRAPPRPWPTFPRRSRDTPCWWRWPAKKSSWRPKPRSAKPASTSRPRRPSTRRFAAAIARLPTAGARFPPKSPWACSTRTSKCCKSKPRSVPSSCSPRNWTSLKKKHTIQSQEVAQPARSIGAVLGSRRPRAGIRQVSGGRSRRVGQGAVACARPRWKTIPRWPATGEPVRSRDQRSDHPHARSRGCSG